MRNQGLKDLLHVRLIFNQLLLLLCGLRVLLAGVLEKKLVLLNPPHKCRWLPQGIKQALVQGDQILGVELEDADEELEEGFLVGDDIEDLLDACELDKLEHSLDGQLEEHDLFLLREPMALGVLGDPHTGVEEHHKLLVTV